MNEYALYKGDEFIDIGTLEELAERTGKSINAIKWYRSPSARKRNYQHIVIKIEE